MHAKALADQSDVEVTAVCDVDPARRQAAHERFDCSVYDTHGEMLAREKPDLVSVVTRSDQHCAMTCDCLAAGAHVVVTKPWALNEAEALRMIEAQRASGRMLLPWLPARWGCVLRRLQTLVREGAVGNVFMVRHAVTSFATRCDWQTERRYGGGYLLNWGPHVIDSPLQLFESPVRNVYGRLLQTINPGDAEDCFVAMMTLGNGTVVQAEYAVAAEDLPSWFVQGDRGTIVVHGRGIRVSRQVPASPNDPTRFGSMKAGEKQVAEETVEGEMYGDATRIYSEVAQAVLGKRPFAVTPEHALELTRVLDAIRRSDEQEKVVALG